MKVTHTTTSCRRWLLRVQVSTKFAAYLICDHRTLRKYGLGCVAPFPLPIGRHLRTGYLLRGSTLRELASKAGIDAATFEATVAEFNVQHGMGKTRRSERGPKRTTAIRATR